MLTRLIIALGLVAALATGAWSHEYECDLLYVTDGDTIACNVEIYPPHKITLQVKIRLRGIDAPEVFSPSKKCPSKEREYARRAGLALERTLESAKRILIIKPMPDKYYGRAVATVIAEMQDGKRIDVSEMLLALGLAQKYEDRKKDYWCAK